MHRNHYITTLDCIHNCCKSSLSIPNKTSCLFGIADLCPIMLIRHLWSSIWFPCIKITILRSFKMCPTTANRLYQSQIRPHGVWYSRLVLHGALLSFMEFYLVPVHQNHYMSTLHHVQPLQSVYSTQIRLSAYCYS